MDQNAELIRAEARRASEEMPKYEARILKLLCDPARVYWVPEKPNSMLGSLVSNPRGTVVQVVKPPGSDLEFELKRTGLASSVPLSVAFERDGEEVPRSHRLQGGSMGWNLQFEARAAARFQAIYRLVHGVAPSIAITHCAKSIHNVPTKAGERPLIEFLSSPQLFGDGFEEMRRALRQAVAAAFHADDYGVAELPGEHGQTMNFLIQAWPGQAVQSNTSCFRLDRLAEYLSPQGARGYFNVSHEQSSEPAGAHEFGEMLLDEILGDYARPRVRAQTYGRFLSEVFTKNRRRADRIYLELLEELGRFWGTLASVKGYSNGESFVSRNVGIRSAWIDAKWRVGLRFMDQDDLHLPDASENDFSPERLLHGMLLDQSFVQGSKERPNERSCLFALSEIYRVTPQMRAAGLRALRAARTLAVQRTRRKLARSISLRDHFSPIFLKKSLACDRLWAAYARERGAGEEGALIDKLLKRFYPEGGGLQQHSKALRESGEHFFLNLNS